MRSDKVVEKKDAGTNTIWNCFRTRYLFNSLDGNVINTSGGGMLNLIALAELRFLAIQERNAASH